MDLVFGALAQSIKEQLETQKLRVAAGASVEQADADAITRLHMHGILTDAQAAQARRKLMERIARLVGPVQSQ